MSVTYPKGFTAGGTACGIKKNGAPDLAVILCDCIAQAAGVFTRNRVKGHSLLLARKNLRNGRAQAIIINAGNANACLGGRGDSDAVRVAQLAAQRFGCSPNNVLTGSTGVIGIPLPVSRIEAGLRSITLSPAGSDDAARAIMTTDTKEKQVKTSVMIGGREVRIGGMAKGSGMIHPNMATLIVVLTTDAAISSPALKSALKSAADASFNRISIDGDTSVCDQALILASGLSGHAAIQQNTEEYKAFTQALTSVCVQLAKMLAADGEGATKLMTVSVRHARTHKDALKIACAIAKSPLCKTAAFGNDANWGRLLTAAGYSGAVFDPVKTDIYIGSVQVCKSGGGLAFDEAAALKELNKHEVVYTIDLNDGSADETMWTCDFSTDYVRINADYRT